MLVGLGTQEQGVRHKAVRANERDGENHDGCTDTVLMGAEHLREM